MQSLYFTPASIGYLTQFILSALITAYLANRLRQREKQRVQSSLLTRFFLAVTLFIAYLTNRLRRREKWSAQSILLAGFFAALTLFIGLLFLDVALLPTPRLVVVYLENTVLGIALVLLLQFTYRFPALYPRRRWESYIVLGMSLLYALYEAYYAVYRFSLLGQGWVDYRPPQADYALAVLFAWAPVVLFRQAISADERPVHWLRKLWRPQGTGARGARDFALIYLLLLVLSIVNIMRGVYTVSTTFYNASLSVGILVVMWLFATAYLNYLPDTTSFKVKLSGVTLTLLLAVLGIVGWVMAPASIAAYRPAIADHQTLHFTPNAQGGYDAAPAPFHFETDLGDRLTVTSGGQGRNQKVDFTFTLFGQTYSEIYVTSIGLLRMGQELYHPNLQNDYGSFPGIFPLLVDLEPASGGGVFARLEPERLIVTWDHLPALHRSEAIFTFQAVLYRDGSFDFTYNGLPDPLAFDPDATPSANPWLRGVTPGLAAPVGQSADLSQPASSGPQGVIQDLYLDFRRHLHRATVPLAWLVLGGSLLIIFGLPTLLRSSLVKPLEALLSGVQQMNDGKLDVHVPVRYNDEIGSLTASFNGMAAELHSLVTGLETRVAKRTRELEAANEQMRLETRERETAQEKIVQQQRTLAVMDERERVGRDLHDGLGQAMGYINVESQATQAFLTDGQLPAAQASLQRISQLSQAAHNDIRNFILGLRTPTISEDLFVTLERYLRQFSDDFGIQAILSTPAKVTTPFFAPAVEEQVLHILREALTNVRKHASAHKVEVLFSITDGQVQIIVSDDGVGFDLSQPMEEEGRHFGVKMMRERAKLVGGNLELRSAPRKGTKILVSIPCLISMAGKATESDLAAARELRLLLVDDSPLFLDGLRNLLMARGLMVVGLAQDGYEAQEKARALHPDVIVMDIQMPRCNGLEATRAIKAELPEVKIVMLTVSEDEEDLFEAIKSGASGYLLKSLDADDFCRLLAGLARGEVILTPNMASRLLADFSQSKSPLADGAVRQVDKELTPRQWQILEMVSEGMQYKEVAATLHLGEQTIKYHMGQILERLHLETRRQAIAYARRIQRKGK